jgi:hypothetical protein
MIYIYLHACMHTFNDVYIYEHACHTPRPLCVCVCVCVCVRVCMCMCVCVCAGIRALGVSNSIARQAFVCHGSIGRWSFFFPRQIFFRNYLVCTNIYTAHMVIFSIYKYVYSTGGDLIEASGVLVIYIKIFSVSKYLV